jgi:hypothetical protein
MKNCHCNKECFVYTHYDKIIYKCDKTDFIFSEEDSRELIENPEKPCDFYEESYSGKIISFMEFPSKKVFPVLPPPNPIKCLENLVNYFLLEKLHKTFQEIEELCVKLDIPLFDNKKETMYQFTQRIFSFCSSSS